MPQSLRTGLVPTQASRAKHESINIPAGWVDVAMNLEAVKLKLLVRRACVDAFITLPDINDGHGRKHLRIDWDVRRRR